MWLGWLHTPNFFFFNILSMCVWCCMCVAQACHSTSVAVRSLWSYFSPSPFTWIGGNQTRAFSWYSKGLLRWPPMSSFSKHFLSTHYVPDTMLVLLAHTDTMFNSLQAGEQKTKPAIRAEMEASLKCRGHSHRAALNQNGSGRASHRRWCVRWGHDTVPVTTIKKHAEFHS